MYNKQILKGAVGGIDVRMCACKSTKLYIRNLVNTQHKLLRINYTDFNEMQRWCFNNIV